MIIRKVMWLSRHEMTREQTDSLLSTFYAEGASGVEIVCQNIIWQATIDGVADRATNLLTWRALLSEADLITGVFPPVALEALPTDSDTLLVSPVSRQAPELRVGEGAIPFAHVRWAIIN